MEKLLNELIGEIVSILKLGQRESVYQNALAIELRNRGYKVELEVMKAIIYKGFNVGTLRLDMLIEDSYIVEFKAIQKVSEKEIKQIKNYLNVCNLNNGFLINVSLNDVQVILVQDEVK
jgi:GxxExxY protein